eukprot:TRINITY_DN6358_c0_g1_i1.p1 TRINITY_DN6358_c0_g1~~TRINITY_DN6358_c0_g1_i1.p1  ORF type:complete len:498 (+),score=86.51 TRINITY_DN6358_c0_g1_i1:82-1575(+)
MQRTVLLKRPWTPSAATFFPRASSHSHSAFFTCSPVISFSTPQFTYLKPGRFYASATPPPIQSSPASSDTAPTGGHVKEKEEGPLVPPRDAQTQRPLYLDMQATTPVDPRVLDTMLPFMMNMYGNPHSRTHQYGWEALDHVEDAREQVAKLIGADAKEVIFTSGATESNNLAIKGVARFYKERKNHILTTAVEHKCILDSCRVLEAHEGINVTYLPVKPNGIIDLDEFEKAIRPDTSMASVMAVNNEIGVIQPLEEIGAICRKHKIFFHTDAAQAVGKIEIDVEKMNIDMLSLSGHKLYGPKGVGALYVRKKPRVRLHAIISGGGQERGLRSGTLPSPLVIGLGRACQVAREEMDSGESARIKSLFYRLYNGITSQVDEVVLNGDLDQRYHGNLNLSFSCVEGESMLMALKDVACSSGSACTSASLEPSYVLKALGVSDDMAHTSLRFGIGRFTTEKEIDTTVDLCVSHIKRLRAMSPLWEMKQDGIDINSIEWAHH